jgi:hypothetical protein
MTIKSLIDKLSKYSPDCNINLYNYSGDYYLHFVRIKEDLDNNNIELILE